MNDMTDQQLINFIADDDNETRTAAELELAHALLHARGWTPDEITQALSKAWGYAA